MKIIFKRYEQQHVLPSLIWTVFIFSGLGIMGCSDSEVSRENIQ